MYLIKISARSSLTRLRIIKANKENSLNVEIENALSRFSSVSFSFKPPR